MIVSGLITGMSLISTAIAQDPPGPTASVPDIVAIGTRDQIVRRYVDALPEVNRPNEPLARFDRWICPGVLNLEAHAQAVADRIGQVAVRAGLGVGEPGCSPNVLVVFTLDADGVAADIRDARPQMFDGVAATRRSGRTQLREFLESDAPVRWWHSTSDEPATAAVEISQMLSTRGMKVPGVSQFRISGPARSGAATLLSSASRMDITMALVIVDMNRIDTVDLNAIADYAAFVALGQIDPSADVSGADTIMNLFEPGQSAIRGLSAIDQSYLRALYRVRGNAARASQQKSEIAADMLHDLNGREAQPAASEAH